VETRVIESYRFGRIIVNGRHYSSDVIIYPDRVEGSWWRVRGHDLCMDDIREILDYGPEVLIIGKGKSGMMKVSDVVRNEIRKLGIELITANTKEAVEKYNNVAGKKKAVAALHLTC
jgi:hypothetical protein